MAVIHTMTASVLRPAQSDSLLYVPAVSAGSADGWSYFGLGHVFVANMTGNTVLLGVAVFQRHGDVLHPLNHSGSTASRSDSAAANCPPIPEVQQRSPGGREASLCAHG
jgi:Protein of unknown function (DUF1275)